MPIPRALRSLLVASAALVVGWLAVSHGLGYMTAFNGPPAPALSALTTPGAALSAAREPRRIVLVVVDGLRADAAPELDLGAIAPDEPRAACVLKAALPSWSRPNYVTLLTGVPPRLSGVHNNEHRGSADLEDVFGLARRAGWRTAVVADGIDAWGPLFPEAFDDARYIEAEAFPAWLEARLADGEAYDPAQEPIPTLPLPGPSLLLLHLNHPDEEGHHHGAASASYHEAVARAGRQIAAVAARLDLGRDTLVVTSDHGHLDRGGHGGPETVVLDVPFVVIGAGAASEAPSDCRGAQLDVAPTLAAIVGLPLPAAGLGAPLTPLLDPARVDVAAVTVAHEAQRSAVVRALGAEEAARAGALAPPSGWGLLVGIVGLTLLVAVLRAALGRASGADGRALAVWAATYPVCFMVIYASLEPALSISAVWDQDPWTLHVGALVGGALVALALVGLVLRSALGGREAAADRGVWLLVAGAAPWILAVGVNGGLPGRETLGDPHASFAVLVSDFVLVGAALGAFAIVAGAAIVGVFRHRS